MESKSKILLNSKSAYVTLEEDKIQIILKDHNLILSVQDFFLLCKDLQKSKNALLR